jgi:hypothetical protein
LILKWGVNLAKKAFEAMVAYWSVILLADFVFVFARFGFYHPLQVHTIAQAAASTLNTPKSRQPKTDCSKLPSLDGGNISRQ